MAEKQITFLHIVVPQGTPDTPKREDKFLQLLTNLHNSATGITIGLELFGYEQYTYFYISVERQYKELIEGLLYSTYPDCEIVEKKDYAKSHEKLPYVVGTSLHFAKSDIYPLKTFSDFENDSLSGIFSVLSKTGKNEQVWIQMLIQPRPDDFSYQFSQKWKMRINRLKRVFRLKNYVRSQGKSEFYASEKHAFLEKMKYDPFYFQMKIGVLTDSSTKSKQKLTAIVKTFYQYNVTDFNEFVSGRIISGQRFIAQYKRRSFTNKKLVSSKELATLYHFPNADHVPHVVHVLAKKAEPPQDIPKRSDEDVCAYGMTNYHNSNIPFGIVNEDRRRHMYIVGKSGSGKSKMIELLMKNDILAGKGIGVLDPHGDLVDNILRCIPEERMKDVIYFDPSDTEYPVAFNPIENVGEAYKMQVTIGFIDIFKKLFGSNWTYRLEHVLRYTTLALLDSPNTTVMSIMKMLTDKNYRQKIVARIQDSVVKNFWVNEFAGWSEKFDAEAITPLLNKVGQFVSTGMIRNMIAQPKNSFDIRDVMDNQKILLMKVSKGLLGEENAALVGSMIITKMYQAAMQRADMKEEDRKDFYMYIDEFQNFATNTFSEILSEARKYRLCLTIAHQYMGQLSPDIQKTVFGNVGTMISFRVGAEDAVILEQEYNPTFQIRDIINLGVRDFYTKMSVHGELREAFSARTLDMNYPEKDFSKEIVELSRKTYAKPLSSVVDEIKKWDESASSVDENIAQDIEEKFEEPLI